MKKIKLLTFLILILSHSARAQFTMQPQNYLSPEVASLVSEVQNPVSLSSGTVAINIPLFEIKEGSIGVPVSLNYDASGVRVNSLAGWVGQNWNLKAGGSISRVIKGVPEETLFKHYLVINLPGDNTSLSYDPVGYFYNRDTLNNPNWQTTSQIKTWAKDIGSSSSYGTGELEPDEFVFNFCGQSGSFYMDRDGKFKIKGEVGYEVKCLLLDSHPQGFSEYDSSDYTYWNDRMLGKYGGLERIWSYPIGGFKITAPDGTLYYFGIYEALETGSLNLDFGSVEIKGDFFQQLFIEEFSAWHLSKIVSPRGDTVEFKYKKGQPRLQISSCYGYNKLDGKSPGFMSWLFGSATMHVRSGGEYFSGYIISPSYLSEFRTSTEVISFSSSNATNIQYDYNRYFNYFTYLIFYIWNPYIYFPINDYRDWSFEYYYNPYTGLYEHGYTNNPLIRINYYGEIEPKYDYMGHEKLNQVTRKSLINNQTVQTFRFDYNSGSNKRLQLKSLKENNDPPYTFSYNTTTLPELLSPRTDHWGYYNNKNAQPTSWTETVFLNFWTLKEPDFTYTKAESLEKITFPTGGSKEFIFEPHNFTKYVKRDQNTGAFSLGNLTRNGGGLRIKEIRENYLDQTIVKHYQYSDGILNGESQYYWPGYQGRLLDDVSTYKADRFMSSTILPVSNNPAGGSVSYSKVTEFILGQGKTEYYFSNHNTTLDENSVSIDLKKSAYSPFSSWETERGRLLEVKVYEENNVNPVKRETYTYQPLNNTRDYIRAVYFRRLSISGTGYMDAIEGSAYKIYTYPYNVIKKTEYLKSAPSNTEIITTNEWTYDTYNQLLTKSTGTTGQLSKTVYSYPYNFASGSNVYQAMKDRNIITPVIEQANYYNNIETDRHRLEYAKNSTVTYDKILPIESKSKYGINSGWETNHSVTQYDKKGNVVEITNKDGRTVTYVWGYGGQYIVAEIQNATFDHVKNSHSSLYTLSNQPLSSGLVSLAQSALRTLTDAQVTTYEYLPLVGCTKVTDPSGRVTSYEYDSSGRLVAVRDDSGNLLQNYEYHFKN